MEPNITRQSKRCLSPFSSGVDKCTLHKGKQEELSKITISIAIAIIGKINSKVYSKLRVCKITFAEDDEQRKDICLDHKSHHLQHDQSHKRGWYRYPS